MTESAFAKRWKYARVSCLICAVAFAFAASPAQPNGSAAAQESAADESTPDDLKAIVREAFGETHAGWSSDEVIIRDDLNRAFIARCQQKLPNASEKDLNWALLNLRKAGKLGVPATQFNYQSYDDVLHIAEIAARSLQDKYNTSIDAILTDPQRRREFDQLAQNIDARIDAYQVRKCAFRLRKARELRPELITRIADWNREVKEFSAAEVAADPTRIPELPGVYLFRDRSGFLYIGEAINLRERLKTHLDNSDRKSLANYLRDQGIDSISIEIHAFPADSRMKDLTVRRAYESELIRSRQPRFNLRP